MTPSSKDLIDTGETLNNALSLERMNEIPELTKSSTVTNKDRTYTRTVVQKTYTRDGDSTKTSTSRNPNTVARNIEPWRSQSKETWMTRSSSSPLVSASQRKVEIRKSESIPSLSLGTRRVVTSKTSPEITSSTIITRTSSTRTQPKQITTRKIDTRSSASETIPLFSSSSKFATKATSEINSPSMSTGSKTTKTRSSSRRSFYSTSSARGEMSTSNPQSRDETVRTRIETRSFTTNSASLPSARQQKEFLPSIQTGIEIPTSTKISTSELSSSLGSLSKERRLQSSQISTSEFSSSSGSSTRENRIPSSQTSTSEFSSSFGSLTGENRLPSSQTSDFTVIRVQERLPGQTPLDQTSNKSTFRRTTSDRNTISSSDMTLLPSSPTFLASIKSQSILPTRSLVRLSFSVFRIPRQEGMTRFFFILFGLIISTTQVERTF